MNTDIFPMFLIH